MWNLSKWVTSQTSWTLCIEDAAETSQGRQQDVGFPETAQHPLDPRYQSGLFSRNYRCKALVFSFCWRNIKMCLVSLLRRVTPHYSGKIWGCFCVDLWAVLVLHLSVFTASLCVAGFQEHLDLCRRGHGRWGGLICGHVPNLTPAANCLSLTVPRDPQQKLMVTLAATPSSFILSAFDHMCLELLKSWAWAGPVHSSLAAQHRQQLSHP